jgi:hypothetical protein
VSKLDDAVAALTDAVERQSRTLDRVDRELDERRHERELARALRPPPKNPRRLTQAFLLGTVPHYLAPFMKEVPGEMCAVDGDHIVVACVCKAEPHVPIGGVKECECGRWFLGLAHGKVLLANEHTIAATLEPAAE